MGRIKYDKNLMSNVIKINIFSIELRLSLKIASLPFLYLLENYYPLFLLFMLRCFPKDFANFIVAELVASLVWAP